MPVSERTFIELALEEPNQWELSCGHLRRKPGMTAEHNHVAFELAVRLRQHWIPWFFPLTTKEAGNGCDRGASTATSTMANIKPAGVGQALLH